MRHLKIALAATCLSIASPALAGPADDIHQLMDDYWATTLKDSPLFATQTSFALGPRWTSWSFVPSIG